MLNQSSVSINPTALYLPQNLPILPKCGRVKTRLHYQGLNTRGEMDEYEVAQTIASIVSEGFTFANAPYAFFQPVGEQDGFQVFRAVCGEAKIPVSDYHRLLSVGKRTTQGRQKTSSPKGKKNVNVFDPNKIDLPSTSQLGLTREQIVRVCLFSMHQVGNLDNLLTDEQRQVAAERFIGLDGTTLWIDDLAVIFRYEDGRLMLHPDPATPEQIDRFPRVAELARRFNLRTDFTPIDITNNDSFILKLFDDLILTRIYSINYNVVQKNGRAMFQGITGTCTGDSFGRLVFRPDSNGFSSSAYQQTISEMGEWDEWTFETDVDLHSKNGVLFIA